MKDDNSAARTTDASAAWGPKLFVGNQEDSLFGDGDADLLHDEETNAVSLVIDDAVRRQNKAASATDEIIDVEVEPVTAADASPTDTGAAVVLSRHPFAGVVFNAANAIDLAA
jgi:hypothetical protein